MRLSRRLLQQTAKFLDHYSQFQPLPLSIETFVNFGADPSKSGSQKASFEFLRKELPVRLANIMREITHLPEVLLRMPSVVCVNNWYTQSFSELTHFSNVVTITDEVLDDFTKTLIHIRDRHSSVVETMAQGMIELKDYKDIDYTTGRNIQYFLDRFYMSRISIRMLINQHTLLFGAHKTRRHPRHIGCIDPKCNVRESVEDAFENAKFLCEQYYQVAPGLHLESKNGSDVANRDVDIVYVPSHLYHMLFELFKNAMRATVEHHKGSDLPVIKVLICKGADDLCIKMSDMGGGIPRSKGDQLFQYMYSTAPQPSPCDGTSAPLAGYGYGLPISRLYARYFHGDLLLNSVEGYGTDAHIYLKVLSGEASEVLPVYNRTASKAYNRDVPVNDWSSPQAWSTSHNSPFSAFTLRKPTSPDTPQKEEAKPTQHI